MPNVDDTLAADEPAPVDTSDATLVGDARATPGAVPPGGSRAPARLAPGDHVGRFLVLARIGAGGMGEVFSAYDPQLDRKLALKLLHPAAPSTDSTIGRTRLLREAQAMARLQHPNTVAVHDVGEHHGRVFLAMEFIAGQTLGAWLQERPRDWREILAVFVAAGRGLAAAHAAKLIHRDFKPDNVMVGDDGRVRVMDFGLARARQPGEASSVTALDRDSVVERLRGDLDGSRTNLSTTVTAMGSLTGTPAYMAPEQFLSEAVDARTDQFSFCVALHEALYGERPFPGDNAAALALSVVQNTRRESTNPDVPAWLRRVIDRGLAIDPDQRWPKLDVLLAELERDRSRRLRQLGIGLAGVALVALATIPWLRRDEPDKPEICTGGARIMAETWSPARVSLAEQAVRATKLDHAADTWTRIAPELDLWSRGWIDAHRETCEATELHRGQSAELMQLRMRCLDRQRRGFAVLVDDLEAADADVVEGAVAAAQALPRPARCADEDYVRAVVPPPEDPEVAAAVDELRRELATSETLRRVAPSERLAEVEALRERAASLDYPPVLAEADLRLGRLHAEQAHGPAAVASLRSAYFSAQALGLDELALGAATELIFATGELEADYASAVEWAEHAAAVITRSGTEDDEARRLDRLAQVHMAKGDNAEAEAELRRALELHSGARGKQDAGSAAIHLTLADLLQDLGRNDEARVEFERGGELIRAELGEGHPRLGLTWLGLAQIATAESRHDDARALMERVHELWSKTLPEDHPWFGDLYNDRSMVYSLAKDRELVRADLERAVEIRRRSLGPDHPSLASALTNLGTTRNELGDVEGAIAAMREAEAIHQRAHTDHSGPAVYTYVQLAGILAATGDLDGAIERANMAERAGIKAFGDTHDMVLRARILQAYFAMLAHDDAARAQALMLGNLELAEARGFPPNEMTFLSFVLLAEAELKLGATEQALAHIERAWALDRPRDDDNYIELALDHAKALWALGRKTEARAAAQRGLEIEVNNADGRELHGQIREWLRGR
ncbi:protein kinase domain-containing protein [Enhygromyxa salina]|uniref:Serine/threonine-protein kinase PK-1 n=1 Tax=Enhygromyxa salina TaxID=215803 RepID=A0A2S9Y7V3_9BACT|nr:tetratricopeptide repeat protein [Enhygromyxa salina]PRQ01190.1 Serine/threonine-protein kinase PK-1 [Enhygromyxa salina]